MARDPAPDATRIAICKTSLFGPISGADETLVTYATELHRAGKDVTVVLLYPCSDADPYFRRLRSEGVPIIIIAEHSIMYRTLRAARDAVIHMTFLFAVVSRFPGDARKIWRAALRTLARYHSRRCEACFRQFRFDVLHILTGDNGAGALIRGGHRAGVAILFQELGTPHHLPELNGTYERLARFTPLCTRIAALSPMLASQWKGKLPNAHDPIVLPLLVKSAQPIAIPRRAAPFSVTFGFAARLERGKGPDVLIEAFARLNAVFDGGYLRLAGGGPLSGELRRRSRQLGVEQNCEFAAGYRTEEGRSAFLATVDICVLPTLAEGTPNGIIEAMAMGIPVIASSVGGIPDMITPETGIIVPPGDIDALAEAMRALAEDPARRAEMGRAARRRYEQIYSPEAMLPTLLRTYREVIVAGARNTDAAFETLAPS